ncbi:formylglycine-generating enzyme family protein [Puteibacter caeruleilacunae]|nr:formylglycine-generating enzyme family protein [Puteibacter caeruleilacunae]
MKAKQFIFLLITMTALTINAIASVQSSFYSKKSTFEATLLSSFEKIQKYEEKHGPVFTVSDELTPDNGQTLSINVTNCTSVYVRSNYESGYKKMWDPTVMIPAMFVNVVNPAWELTSGGTVKAENKVESFNDLTQRFGTFNGKRNRTFKLNDGKVKAENGFEFRYHWVSQAELLAPKNAKTFKTAFIPKQGTIYSFIYTDEFNAFLEALKHDFPMETEMFLGKNYQHLKRIAGFKKDAGNLSWGKQIDALVNADSRISSANGNDAKAFLNLVERQSYLERLDAIDFEALELAIKDIKNTYPQKYSKADKYLSQLDAYKSSKKELINKISKGDENAFKQVVGIEAFQQEALLANPAIDFENILLIKRQKLISNNKSSIGQGPDPFGLASNFQSLSMINRDIWDNEIASYSLKEGNMKTVLKPDDNRFIGLFDLHFDAEKMLFSLPTDKNQWQVFESNADGSNIRQVSPTEESVDNYDACYLPNEEIIFSSTRNMHGVPCVSGSSDVANLCRMDKDGGNIRMLCFDQDDNWHPTMLNNGKVMYTRWEYTDEPHYFTRVLMNMNPDGTNQKEYYGSSSYWPNSIFYTKAIPNHPTKVVGIVTGHHGTRRAGELVIFDPVKGRFETDGVIQKIPGRGQKVEATIADRLVDDVWPKFLTPYPINEKYFLVAMQKSPYDKFGIYLVDVFDNLVPLITDTDYAFFEPVPLKKTQRPPVIPDRVNLDSKEATIYISDIYEGRAMKHVPRGTVKSLRLFEPNYAVRKTGGHINIGIDGPWDAKKIMGTVPVYPDGSAHFTVPANTPIAVQPLDEKGQAVQVMRSWFTAMPGERLSCVGCHEDQNMIPPARFTEASRKKPSIIKEWYGPARGFSFKNEVQPVLDRYCAGCHTEGKGIPDFSRKQADTHNIGNKKGKYDFTPSYVNLHPYVRRAGNEGDYRVQNPYEYHANTSELVQKLRKGHHNVQMDAESWDRLITWIDLNVPDKGTWTERAPEVEDYIKLREKYRKENANLTCTPEEPVIDAKPVAFIPPKPEPKSNAVAPTVKGWPFNTAEAKAKQNKLSDVKTALNLGNGVTIDLVQIPAGEFVMGNNDGDQDERPASKVAIDKPFYMSTTEITAKMYKQYKAEHDQGVVNYTSKDVRFRGHLMNIEQYPAVRISWDEAMKFCKWLSEKTGKKVTLPTEAQWEWACRAGSQTPFSYGDNKADFSQYANLADQALKSLASRSSPTWHPRDDRFNDNAMITTNVGSYQPNAWGLYDMHGNAAEWTRSSFAAYPYKSSVDATNGTKKTVRGGSWYDRPYRSTSSYRLGYNSYQRIHNVGFRIVIED